MSAPSELLFPRPPRPALLLVVAVAAGAAISLQFFLNGRLGERLGSFEIAAAINTTSALLALLLVAGVTGTRAKAVAGLRRRPVERWWHWLIGATGAALMLLTAYAAPRLGVALLTVALVCGQTVGSLAVDHFGMSPAGRQSLSTPRVAGALLALIAVGIGAIGTPTAPHPVLLALVVLTGAGAALQQAVLGHLGRNTGQPLAAAVINFVVGAAILLVVALAVTGGSAPHGLGSASPVLWLGGLIGATLTVLSARLVPRIGVLRLMLGLVAGQTLGALALGVVLPGAAGGITLLTILGVALTLLAVTIGSAGPAAGRGGRLRRFRSAPAPAAGG